MEILHSIVNVCIDIAWRLVAALIVLVIGRSLIKYVLKKIGSSKKTQTLDPTVKIFIDNFLRLGLYALLGASLVGILGVPIASVITLFASAGAAIALAVKGSFSNLVGGIMLLIFKPISVNEFIEIEGKIGTVEEVGIFYTQLRTADNLTVSIPNAIMTESVITNYSRKDLRRLDIALEVAYGSDNEKVKSVIKSVLDAHENALKDPAPFIRMTAMNDSALEYTVRVWCNRGDYGLLKSDLLEAFEKTFTEEGIDVPFPQLDVFLKNK